MVRILFLLSSGAETIRDHLSLGLVTVPLGLVLVTLTRLFDFWVPSRILTCFILGTVSSWPRKALSRLAQNAPAYFWLEYLHTYEAMKFYSTRPSSTFAERIHLINCSKKHQLEFLVDGFYRRSTFGNFQTSECFYVPSSFTLYLPGSHILRRFGSFSMNSYFTSAFNPQGSMMGKRLIQMNLIRSCLKVPLDQKTQAASKKHFTNAVRDVP